MDGAAGDTRWTARPPMAKIAPMQGRTAPMLSIEPTGAILGATVRGVDLSQELRDHEFGHILNGLGRFGVLRFPDQHIDLGHFQRFSEASAKSRATRSALPPTPGTSTPMSAFSR